MGEAKRRSKNPRPPEPDAKVVAVRDVHIEFPVHMRREILESGATNSRLLRSADKSVSTAGFISDLFSLQPVAFACWRSETEPGGIGVIVAKGLDAVLRDIETPGSETRWTSIHVRDQDAAHLVGIELGDMAMVTVPFDGDNDDEMQSAIKKADDLAAYELAKKRA